MYLFPLQKAWYLTDVQVGLQMDGEGRAVVSDPGTSEKVGRQVEPWGRREVALLRQESHPPSNSHPIFIFKCQHLNNILSQGDTQSEVNVTQTIMLTALI